MVPLSTPHVMHLPMKLWFRKNVTKTRNNERNSVNSDNFTLANFWIIPQIPMNIERSYFSSMASRLAKTTSDHFSTEKPKALFVDGIS